jgi:hypothetical protein
MGFQLYLQILSTPIVPDRFYILSFSINGLLSLTVILFQCFLFVNFLTNKTFFSKWFNYSVFSFRQKIDGNSLSSLFQCFQFATKNCLKLPFQFVSVFSLFHKKLSNSLICPNSVGLISIFISIIFKLIFINHYQNVK